MKRILFGGLLTAMMICSLISSAQTISMRVQQASYSNVDPDAGGPATGSVVIEFQLMASDPGILADGIPFSAVYQSSLLMQTPTNTTQMAGPLAAGASWTQNVDNRAGNAVVMNYGGRAFDRRMIISFVQSSGIPNVEIPTTWTGFARITYWTLGPSAPQGGHMTTEPGAIVAQNELSTDGGLTTYPYATPNLAIPIPLGESVVTPVTFTGYDVTCGDKGTVITWATGSEVNSSHYEIERSTNGASWTKIDQVMAAGNSNNTRSYQYLDLQGGDAFYRIRQVDVDGRFIHTAIKHVNCDGKKGTAVLFPVPTSHTLNIALTNDKMVRTELQVIDMSGRVVKRQAAVINNGSTNITINVSSLPAGEYILISSDKTIVLNKKFTIAR
jgi:hypothetical protein